MTRTNEVREITVEQQLGYLRSNRWLVPEFQRDFVWKLEDCESFAASILGGRPIGMVTVWKQAENSGLALEGLSLTSGKTRFPFGPVDLPMPHERLAILDGRQRSQAAAMVFGGLRPKTGRFAGRFFLDVRVDSSLPRVEFIRSSEIKRRGIEREDAAIEQGLIPLDSLSPQSTTADGKQRGPIGFLMDCAKVIREQSVAGAANPISVSEKENRERRLNQAIDGFMRAKLAVYQVAEGYSLGEICEIFEKLNTTSVKVSTVDLIHSWLYGDTSQAPNPFNLREWIKETAADHSLSDWISVADRPELTVQMVAACYLACADDPSRPAPRRVGRNEWSESIKNDDLLALPTSHWVAVAAKAPRFAGYLIDFQRVVGNGDGRFGWKQCPYPSVAAIYVGLRWRLDHGPQPQFKRDQLDRLFRAFFWRNSLSGRYDQGMMTKFADDLRALRKILDECALCDTDSAWVAEADRRLKAVRDLEVKPVNEIERDLQECAYGAMESALLLPQRVTCSVDLVTGASLQRGAGAIETHHVFPRAWCINNNTGQLRMHLGMDDPTDRVSAPVNLMPLSRKSNNEWRASNPAKVIADKGLSFESRREACIAAFIDTQAFDYLEREMPLEFWRHRARTMAMDLENRMRL
jgi:hypothetical protein